ncbi:sigma factor-like helix-turn-helix DNA-binding protein [Dialister micraerophilus]|uniref:RNA polymerase sigma-70 region 4 domain-containing protein n=1 Tax=Dialister micraerophilus UPII 345-E TaxID=910314 RepID=E4L8B7_9FIRM|nr:sigma factor-like helix-turn-helix DNA-binding protein [Dialister micraerophilus]EFR43022.1 hypothetical protein HMPREF9220_1100 [Dialister micraerophilus UPII 345-E]
MDDLKNLVILNNKINNLLMERSQLKLMLETVKGQQLHERISGTKDTDFSAALDKLIALEKEIDSLVDEYVDQRKKIISALELIRDDRYRELLNYRYVCGLSLNQISKKMNFSYNYIRKLHRRAIYVYDKVGTKRHI